MSTIQHMDAANIFIGDDEANQSLFLKLKNIKFPELEEKTESHEGSGAVMEIEMGMNILAPLQLSFDIKGFDANVMKRFMPAGRGREKYTLRGNLRDVRSGTETALKCVVEGRMTKVGLSDFAKSSGMDSSYEIKEVVFYELFEGGDEKWHFEYFSGPAGARRNGEAMFPTLSSNLGLI